MVRKRLTAALLGAVAMLGTLAVATPSQAIIGGHQAPENYSFLVHLSTRNCAGVLIKANWVATAKQCVIPTSGRVGSIDRDSGGTTRAFDYFVNHPFADLRLLRLATSVSEAPAPIAASPPVINNVLYLVGWGHTCVQGGCGTPRIAHEYASLATYENRCSGRIELPFDGENEICLATTNGGPCTGEYGGSGDAGGPAIREIGGRWHVHGITSRPSDFGTCGTSPQDIATDLAILRPWIEGQVGTLPT